jgi:prolyl-tRNA synthetase
MSRLCGRRLKEDPKDAKLQSHKFLIRGGYVRQVTSGIYSALPMGLRVLRKVESIIREEMNRIDGQEVLLPVAMPRELWEESGRWESVGQELLRFRDRTGKDMLLGMTHEEAVVHLARNEVSSYKDFPFMLYQIQTKFRDEPRSRGGLIRVREFTMKDAYSFHTDTADMEEYYTRAHKAYSRIFARAGLKNVAVVASDAGIMGGGLSHEFMLVTPGGEDTLIICSSCSYRANKEVAVSRISEAAGQEIADLEKVHTPNCKTIEDVAAFLKIEPSQTAKAVFFADAEGKPVFVVVRGDREVNEIKLKKVLQTLELRFLTDEEIRAMGSEPGYASPMGVDGKDLRIVVDPTVASAVSLVTGANEADHHYRNFNFDRDLRGKVACPVIIEDIISVEENDACVECGKPLNICRGIEIGNIFQLGEKYSKPMNMTFVDDNGRSHNAVMGCYGIGVGRLMASVMEESNDKWGPIWPISIAPYQVHICALNMKNEPKVREVAEAIYQDLQDRGIEVIYDDRDEKAGPQFADADLTGIPLRVVVSPKTVAEDQVEFKIRGIRDGELVALDDLGGHIEEKIDQMLRELDETAEKAVAEA